MNIVVLLGSLRTQSFNRYLFNHYAEASKGLFTFTEILTSDFPLYNFDLETNFPDKIITHANTIRAADGLMFFSPEYNYSLPGHLKNAIDWLSRVPEQPFNNKKAAIIGCASGKVGTARMQYELRKIGVFLNLHFLNKPEFMLGEVNSKFNESGQLIDDATQSFIASHVESFSNFLK